MNQAQSDFSVIKDVLMVPQIISSLTKVAMTRAKMFLAVIGDGETIQRERKGGFLDKWISWLEENAEIRYPDVVRYIADN